MSSTPSLAEDSIDVWLARDPELRDPALLAGFARILSDEERRRVAGMQFEAGRHQQLVTRAMARNVLSCYLPGVPPADWRFERGEHGRPSVAAEMPAAARELNFNLAHAEGLVVMAVARVERLGVDVERVDPAVNLAVARRYFSPAESAALDALPPEQRARRFQRLWTLKEAYLKAIGTGISGGLGSITFHLGEGIHIECSGAVDASLWQFQEFAIEADHLAAVACRAADGGQLSVKLRNFPREVS
jgi:4'-phosphopantetheinyl transferase